MVSQQLLDLKQDFLKDLSISTIEQQYYSKEEIKNCDILIDEYFLHLEALHIHTNAKIMSLVDSLVLSFNTLHKKCNSHLIQHKQQEKLCELIIIAAKQYGLHTDVCDITKDLRDW